ncbi:OLC1v1036168C1 [Oldenlandia corymbosa var. corymbosa]|uniref:OLC1v1036168C1 n=1 Tax=Oldenlandia corymbosa var. corymbosa TaxID=529605 RepID=A0AAV1CVG9_OLDCO|nr:OLC1v1036168C1 [Oldenlandia corymbosa var. corymbosa]
MEISPTSFLSTTNRPLTLLHSPSSSSSTKITVLFPSKSFGRDQYNYQYNLQLEANLLWEHKTASYRYSSFRGRFTEEDEDEEEEECSFDEAVELFNRKEYYKCHDVLEAIWNKSQEPARTLVHGILQCAVGFYHLFNQNHKGAMMELGEGLCKLRKMNFETGPFHQFEEEISAVLDFIHQTQLELAACTKEFCLTMDQSERSYQLLGGYAAGQPIYRVDKKEDNLTYIFFFPEGSYDTIENFSRCIELPILKASEDHLVEFQSKN